MEMKKATTKNAAPAAKKASEQPILPPSPRKARKATTTTPSMESPPLPPQVVDSLAQAAQTGTWLIAVFRIQNNRMQLERTAHNFPIADLDLACRLFVESLLELKQ